VIAAVRADATQVVVVNAANVASGRSHFSGGSVVFEMLFMFSVLHMQIFVVFSSTERRLVVTLREYIAARRDWQ